MLYFASAIKRSFRKLRKNQLVNVLIIWRLTVLKQLPNIQILYFFHNRSKFKDMLKSMDISERIKDIGEMFVNNLSEISKFQIMIIDYENMDICKNINFQSSKSNMYIIRL